MNRIAQLESILTRLAEISQEYEDENKIEIAQSIDWAVDRVAQEIASGLRDGLDDFSEDPSDVSGPPSMEELDASKRMMNNWWESDPELRMMVESLKKSPNGERSLPIE